MLSMRLIPCLDVLDGRVVKGTKFRSLRDAGDPVELAQRYNDQGADELVFLDIGATHESRRIMIDVVEKVSARVFVPLTVGGGVRSLEDMTDLLHAGADKISMCSAALKKPDLLRLGAARFGAQCMVLSIDAKKTGSSWNCFLRGGRVDTGMGALEWAVRAEQLGAGEILLNSIDQDGTGEGYDLELTRLIGEKTRIPIIASGGAGTLEQIYKAVRDGQANAVLVASLLHYGTTTIAGIKNYLRNKGVSIR